MCGETVRMIMIGKHFVTKVPPPSSDVIDIATRNSGLDCLIEYNDMVRKLHSKNFDWLKNNKSWIRKF